MKSEQLHDALNLLDNDLIEAVDVHRTGYRKHGLTWVRTALLAACLCVVAASVWLLPKMAENTVKDSACSDFESDIHAPEAPEEAVNEGVADGSMGVQQCVMVRIDSLYDGGFVGTVSEEGNIKAGERIQVVVNEKETLCIGDTVTVQFSRIEKSDDLTVIYADKISKDFA